MTLSVAESPHHPYVPRKILTLFFEDGQAMDGPPPFKGLYVVKIYDRRFATELREHEGIPIWTTDFEAEYSQFIRSDCAPEFFDLCTKESRKDLNLADGELNDAWDKGRQEAYLQYLRRQHYNTESYAYDLLHDIQGIHVPEVFARVSLQISDKPNGDLDCPGFLLEFSDGFQLANLAENAPQDSWQRVCEDVIEIIHMTGDRGICKKDVKVRNFVMRRDSETGALKPFVIDFGLCAFHSPVKKEREFSQLQANEDE